jgi:hypothetical protein
MVSFLPSQMPAQVNRVRTGVDGSVFRDWPIGESSDPPFLKRAGFLGLSR